MHRNNPYIFLIAMIALTLLAAPAGATTIPYNTQSAWAAASANVITATFSGTEGPSQYTWYNTGGGLTVSGVNFIGYTGEAGVYSLKVYNPLANSTFDRGSGPSIGGGYAPSYLLATLPGIGAKAVAFNWTTEVTGTPGKSVTINLSTGDSYTLTGPTDSSMKFFGVISDIPITSVQFSTSNTFTMVDNFAYGEETSEPAAILLGATGLAGIWLARRLRRYSDARAVA